MNTSAICKRFSSPVVLFVFVGAYLLTSYVMGLITNPITFDDFINVELSFNPQDAVAYYTDWTQRGIMSKYFWGLVWDFVYMIAYGGLLLSVLSFWVCKTSWKEFTKKVYLSLPVIAVIFDVLENVMEFVILAKFPQNVEGLVKISTTFSLIKWIFVGLSIFAVVLLGIRYIFVYLFGKKS